MMVVGAYRFVLLDSLFLVVKCRFEMFVGIINLIYLILIYLILIYLSYLFL